VCLPLGPTLLAVAAPARRCAEGNVAACSGRGTLSHSVPATASAAGIDHGAAFEDPAPELDVSGFRIVADGHERFGQAALNRQELSPMATYQMVYGDDEQVVRETYEDIDSVEREDGWVVLFRGPEAILRVQESHVQSLELIDS
jgi:hypothetical protein